MAERFWIHYADPGFPDPPWPGVRRVGPFNNVEEAKAQAASDAATGQGVALGVVNDLESNNSQNASGDRLNTIVSAKQIQKAADEIILETMRNKVQVRAENDAALQNQLDQHGLSIEDLQDGVTK